MFVELTVLLRDLPNPALAEEVLRTRAAHRVEHTGDGLVVVAVADDARRTGFSFGTTSVYDDPDWEATVTAVNPDAWRRVQPVVHQVDVSGRLLERGDLEAVYAVAIALAERYGGMVWDAVAEQPVGDDPTAAAERCATALEQAEEEYAASRAKRGFLVRLFGR